MFSLLKSNKIKTSYGLDIYTTEVRLAALEKNRIKTTRSIPLPKDAITEHRIKHPHAIIQAIESLTQAIPLQEKKTAIALPAACVMKKHIKLPAVLCEAECEAEIMMNISSYFPEIRDKLCVDFVSIHRNKEEQDIVLFASRQEVVDEYVAVVTESGWVVNRVDIDMYAKMRGLHHVFPEILQGAFLEIEENKALFLLLQAHNILFYHSFMFDSEKDIFSQIKYAIKLSEGLQSITKIYVTAPLPRNLEEQCEKELMVKIEKIEADLPCNFWTSVGLAAALKMRGKNN